jgi:hypothetical protein
MNMKLYSPRNVSGGTIDGAVIGGTTPAAGTFTTFEATGHKIITANSISYNVLNAVQQDSVTDATTNGTTTISKAGENFNTTCIVGDTVLIWGGTTTADYGVYSIKTVTSDTALVLDRACSGSVSDMDFYVFRGGTITTGSKLYVSDIDGLSDGSIPLQAIANTYGVSWDESGQTYVRTGSLAGQPCSQSLADALLPIHAAMRRCILNDAGEVQYYLGATDSTKREDGVLASVLDGTNGQVMTQIPAFYYKYGFAGTTHTWEISLTPADGFSLHPAFIKNGVAVDYRYIGAYEGIGYDNGTTAYIDCGTAAANNWAGGAIDLANDKLGSVSGFAPMMDETRAEFRAIAANRGTGWRQQDFDLVSAIQLLYITEYADWNSQLMIGEGRTALSGGTWVKDSYIGVTGKSNADGNGTNSVGGNTNNAYMTYRGIENFFGNIWKWVDGININGNVPYVSNNDVNFADDTAANYTDLGITLGAVDGYVKTLEQQARGFLPASVGGASNTYITDYYYQAAGWRVALLGGAAVNGTSVGVACWLAANDSANDYFTIGSRLCF